MLTAVEILLDPHTYVDIGLRKCSYAQHLFHSWPEEDFADMCSRGPTPACDPTAWL
jgi:hypothetical protein